MGKHMTWHTLRGCRKFVAPNQLKLSSLPLTGSHELGRGIYYGAFLLFQSATMLSFVSKPCDNPQALQSHPPTSGFESVCMCMYRESFPHRPTDVRRSPPTAMFSLKPICCGAFSWCVALPGTETRIISTSDCFSICWGDYF